MKHRLTHELLHYLKVKGYTMLVGIGQTALKDYVFTPVEWDVNDFLESSHFTEYDNHSIHIIDELLKLDLKHLFTHRVIMPDGI